MLPEIPDQVEALRESNVRLFERVKDLEALRARDAAEIEEWEAFGFSLVREMGALKGVAREVNLEALAEQFAREASMDVDGEEKSALWRVSVVQAKQFADEFEKRASEDGDRFRSARMKALEVVGTSHVHSKACVLAKSILRSRGWIVDATLEGVGESRALLAILAPERK